MISGIGQIFNDSTLSSLKLSLQASAADHNAIASNIANINTPGYQRVDLSSSFKTALDNALHQLNSGVSTDQVSVPAPSIGTAAFQNPARADGNTVNIDQEMTNLMKNQTDFDFSAQLLAMHYSAIKDAMGATGK